MKYVYAVRRWLNYMRVFGVPWGAGQMVASPKTTLTCRYWGESRGVDANAGDGGSFRIRRWTKITWRPVIVSTTYIDIRRPSRGIEL